VVDSKGNGRVGAIAPPGTRFLARRCDAGRCRVLQLFFYRHIATRRCRRLFAQHGSRITDFRRGEKLGTCDHRVSWQKPNVRPDWMSQQDYLAFPDQLTLRELQVSGKILVTTMLDPREVNKAELSDLYRMRWNA